MARVHDCLLVLTAQRLCPESGCAGFACKAQCARAGRLATQEPCPSRSEEVASLGACTTSLLELLRSPQHSLPLTVPGPPDALREAGQRQNHHAALHLEVHPSQSSADARREAAWGGWGAE